jgi:uncharacterized protein YbjT (DUF2867 family)
MRVFVAGATGAIGQYLVHSLVAKAKRELGWAPRYPSWRDGFPVWVKAEEQDRAA